MKKTLLFIAMIVVGVTLVSAQSVKIAASNKGNASHAKAIEMPINKVSKSLMISPTKVYRSNVALVGKSLKYQKMSSLHKVTPKHANRINAFKSHTPLLRMKASTDTTFHEGFESFDGVSQNWIPTNWTELNKVAATKYVVGDSINPTWAVNAANDYTSPSVGNSMAWVDWDGVGTTARAQDVWLISPAFTPKSGDIVSFNYFYNPYWMYIDYANSTSTTDVFNFTKPNATMQLYVSINNGTSWPLLWDAIQDAAQFDATTLGDWANSTGSWNTIIKALDAYSGKSIKIAFCYVGKDGDSMGIDEVSVRQLAPSALYGRPKGYFYAGLTPDFMSSAADYLFGPAFESTTWDNYSNLDSKSFLWTFADPANTAATVTSTEVHPQITYLYDQVKVPTLKATAGTHDSIYTWGAANKAFIANGGSTNGLGAGNYDLNQFYYDFPVANLPNNYLFGTCADSSVDAIGNFFEKPVHKYIVDSLWISLGAFSAPVGTEFKVIIHRVVDGSLTDTIATATCTTADVLSVSTLHTMVFKGFKSIDPSTGLEISNDFLEISDGIFVELTGFNKPGIILAALAQGYDSPTGDSNAYVYLNTKNTDGTTSRNLYGAPDYIGAYTSLFFNLGATYSFLTADGDKTFIAPIAGGNKTFNVTTYYSPGDWWSDVELPSWLKMDTTFNETTWATTVTLKTEALPVGTVGRGAVVTISTYGADMNINVTQGDYTGLKATKAINTKVVNTGNSFELGYTSDFKSVSIYNVAGQLLRNLELPTSGKLNVSTNDFKKGIYIFKFVGKTIETAKVIR
ncbi:MAG: T9SS type A sorting domain-containing protein [Paludibacter sp.]